MLSNGSEIIDVSRNTNVSYWNATLLQDPVFHPSFISFVLDGSFHFSEALAKKEPEAPPAYSLMPIHVTHLEQPVQMQLFVSEMTIN